MKSVLMSINKPHTDNIKALRKTIEVRKGRPNQQTPFSCYIYETKKKGGCGKVIGEFVCDEIYEFKYSGGGFLVKQDIATTISTQAKACLSDYELRLYAEEKIVYGWHISDLKIYNKPKELGEFVNKDIQAIKQCKYRERVYTNPEHTNGVYLLGSYLCNKTSDWCNCCKSKPLSRPPQSWQFIEGI